jgi:sugar lactone lactonase YvrE
VQAQFSHPRKHRVVSQRLVALVAALLLLAAIVAGSALADESESETYGSPEITRAAVEEAASSSSIEQQLTDVGLAEELPHADLGREEAIELDNGVFEGELESPAGMFDELEPSVFYSDYAAVIPAGSAPEPASIVVGGETADQYEGPTLLESTIPLATRGENGEREVVNLSLADEEGALKPANPLVETALPENLADGMTLGPSGLKISIIGAPADRSPSVVDGSVGFYPNVATDTDLAVAPTPTGLETFSSLRTAAAPREITYALTVPTGSRLQQTAGEGAAVISASGETEVSIAKPTALDATGAEVPIEMEVDGSDLHLVVKAGEEPHLPILVDPFFQYEEFKWYEQNTTAGTSNFKVESSAPALKTGTTWSSGMPNPGISLNSPGLYVQAPSGARMAAGTGTLWGYAVPRLEADEEIFGAPPTSFIASMDLHDLGFFKEWTWNGSTFYSPGEDPRYLSGIWDSYNDKWASSWSHGGEQEGGSVTNFGITYHYPGNNDHNAKLAEPVGLWAESETYMGFGPREAYVGYVGISLGDEDKPHFASVSSPEWNDGSKSVVPIPFTATDTGLGVRSISVADPVNLPPRSTHQNASLSCWSQANPCPRTWNSNAPGMPQAGYEPAKLPSGITKLTLKAHDPVGNTSTATVLAKVDRTAPAVALSGGLTETGPKVRPRDYSLLVTAKDGSESAPQAGVGSVEIKIDGTQVKDVGCEKQNCEMTPEWVLHTDAYSLGAHTAEVVVTDRVGHVSKREIKFSVEKDTTAPEITHFAHFTQISYGPSIWAEEVAAKDPLSGVAKTELFVDGKHVEAAVNSCAEAEDEEEGRCFAGAETDWHAFLVNMAELSPGAHTMEAVVTDGAGNVARQQATLSVEAGVGASKVAPSLTLAGTMTEQASLGTTRPRYILKTEAGAGSESEGWTPVFQSAFGTSGSGPGQLNGPRGIATDGSGHVWVVDRANNRVEEYGEGGEYISQFGSAGSGNGQFKEPWGIAVTRAGNIWVTDTGNQRVEEFNGKGEFIQKFGSKAGSGGSKGTEFMAPEGIASGPGGMLWVSDGAGHRVSEFRESVTSESERFVRNVTGATLVEPMSVALDASGDVWVADEEANRVFEFGPEGAYLQTIGTSGSGNGQLSGPTGVVVAPSGDIYVVDRNNNRVQIFHPNGPFVTKFGTTGTGNGNFSEPRAIALGAGNVIFVTDKGNNRVHKWIAPWESPPTFTSAFGTSGSGPGQLNGPRGIATDGSGHVWVVDRANNRVEEYGEGGEYISQFGSAGSGNGQFKEPWGIAVTRAGNIWVTDTGNQRVEEFNGKGEFIQKFGSKAGSGGSKGTEFMAPEGIASGPGGMLWVSDGAGHRVSEFRESVTSESERFVRNVTGATLVEPMSVALDASGDVWVADEEANRVFEFGPEGAYLQTIGTSGSGNGQLSGPTGVVVAPSGDIYVVDRNNNRVQIFHPNGPFVTKFGTTGTGNGNFSEPRAIALGAGNVIFVTDKGNNRVHKWTQAASPPGVARTEITVEGNAVGASPVACLTGNCTQAREWVLNASESSVGSHSVVVRATTEAGITTTKTLSFEIQKDTTKPTLTIGGELPNAPDGWVEQHRYGLNATATDSNGSGIKSLVLKVDGVPAESVSKSCLEGGCKAALTSPVNTADFNGGAHVAQVIATDGAGNTTTKSWTLNVDPKGFVGEGESTSTLEAVEETSPVDVVGPSQEEPEIEGTGAGLKLNEGSEGFEAEGGTAPMELVPGENEDEPCSVRLEAPAIGSEVASEPAEEVTELAGEASASSSEQQAAGTVVLYQPKGEPVEVTPEATRSAGCSPKLVNEAVAVESNTEAQVDTITRPLYDGSMTFEAIRSPDSPESYSWEVQLEEGQTLKLTSEHSAEIYYEDGTPAMEIDAEPAHDATGAEVPTSLAVSGGNEVDLTIHHHALTSEGKTVVYPVLAGSGYQVGHEEVIVEYPPEPEEGEPGEEAVGIEEGGVADHLVLVQYGPPAVESKSSQANQEDWSTEPPSTVPKERRYKFTYCWPHHIPGDPSNPVGTAPPVEGDHRANLSRETAECHRKDFHGVFWGVTVHGVYTFKVHHWVRVPGPPTEQCDHWGHDEPATIHCKVTTTSRNKGPVSAIGDYRFPSEKGEFVWSDTRGTCLEFGGEIYPREEPPTPGPYMEPRLRHAESVIDGVESCPWK